MSDVNINIYESEEDYETEENTNNEEQEED